VLTGSQLPIGVLRTDGKENLITAIEIAAARDDVGQPLVPEVSVFFESSLMRGNRTIKASTDHFNAFRSYNYPLLAYAGVHIRYDMPHIHHPEHILPLRPHYILNNNIAILKLFPGISPYVVESVLMSPGLRGVVLETFGSGNASRNYWFLAMLKAAVDRGIVIVNVTQCMGGHVEMHRYDTGRKLLQVGVISGYDSTTESAVTKLMYLFSLGMTTDEVKENMNRSLVGEITLPTE
jgi:L-asparaginase